MYKPCKNSIIIIPEEHQVMWYDNLNSQNSSQLTYPQCVSDITANQGNCFSSAALSYILLIYY